MTQDGKSVKFYDDLVKGKKVVLTFMNTDPAALASSKRVSQNLSVAVSPPPVWNCSKLVAGLS